MPDTVITDELKIAAAKNDYGKSFTLGDGDAKREFEIKDLGYFDYIEFMTLVKPLITVAAGALEMNSEDGEMKVDFNPANVDYDQILKLCGKELPKLAGIICRQTDAKLKDSDVAILARRPQRLVEIVLLQVIHNNLIQEFGSFFQRLTAMVTTLVPTVASVAGPTPLPTDNAETTPSS